MFQSEDLQFLLQMAQIFPELRVAIRSIDGQRRVDAGMLIATFRKGESMASTSKVTRDHDEIRRWAEDRGGRPAHVAGTGSGEDIGILRIEFPDAPGSNDAQLEELSWDQFFKKFDERGLALLYQEQTADGAPSNFNKLVSAETADGEEDSSPASGTRTERKAGGAKKAAPRKSVVKKSPAKKAATKKAATKKAAAKKSATKKSVSKKSVTKKTIAKSAASRGAAAKKAVAKKATKKASRSNARKAAGSTRSAAKKAAAKSSPRGPQKKRSAAKKTGARGRR
jgi:hypothetical protein